MSIDINAVKQLREKTGASIMECKTALAHTQGDIQRAVEYLKRRGIALAEEKQAKATLAGRIGAYVHINGKIGVLLELACETDFVANNLEFQTLLKDLCLQVAAMKPMVISRQDIPLEEISKEKEFYSQEVKDKPSQIVEKIVAGKLDKFYYSQKCLLEQPFIKDETIKVGDLIKSYITKFGENIEVKRFVRFEI